MVPFSEVGNYQLFVWRGVLYMKIHNVYDGNKLSDGEAMEMGKVSDGVVDLHPTSMHNKFNPYCEVVPVTLRIV